MAEPHHLRLEVGCCCCCVCRYIAGFAGSPGYSLGECFTQPLTTTAAATDHCVLDCSALSAELQMTAMQHQACCLRGNVNTLSYDVFVQQFDGRQLAKVCPSGLLHRTVLGLQGLHSVNSQRQQ